MDFGLPSEIIDAILVRLPIKDAVRTSILSSKWRCKWQTMSELRFDVRSLLPPSTNQRQDEMLKKLVRIVDSVLSLHVGPIKSFELLSDLPCCPDIDRWIVHLSRRHVKEILLFLLRGKQYRVPASIFRCEGLTRLELWNCVLGPTRSFSKFSSLKNLELVNVLDPTGRIGALLSNCPCLEFLYLDNIQGPNQLKVHAPNLKEIIISDITFKLIVDHASYVSKAVISLREYTVEQNLNREGKIDIIKVLCCLASVEDLQLLGYSLQCLYGDGSIPNALPASYDCLKKLHLVLDFTAKEDFIAALFLLGSTPTLQVLEILVVTESPVTNPWELRDFNIAFNALRTVKMVDITGAPQELWLIKSILANAPMLKSMTISIAAENTKFDSSIFIELLEYQRASRLAKIIYKEQLEFNCWI